MGACFPGCHFVPSRLVASYNRTTMPAYRHPFRVRFDNVDYARVLYFARQIDFFVEGLEEFCQRELGISFRRMLDEERLAWPTVHLEVDYFQPLNYEDHAELQITLRRIGEKSLHFEYQVERLPDRQVTCRAKHVVAMISMDSWQSVPVPEHYRRMLEPWLESERVEPDGA